MSKTPLRATRKRLTSCIRGRSARCGISLIHIFNFDNIAHSVEDCLENGWWKTAADDKSFLYEYASLGLDASLSENGDHPYEDKLLDAVIEKFGTPHYVRYLGDSEAETDEERRRAIYDDMEKANDPEYDGKYIYITYYLVYELNDDLIMTVAVWETRMPDGSFVLNVDYALFWSRECWENRSAVDDESDEWHEVSLFTVYGD